MNPTLKFLKRIIKKISIAFLSLLILFCGLVIITDLPSLFAGDPPNSLFFFCIAVTAFCIYLLRKLLGKKSVVYYIRKENERVLDRYANRLKMTKVLKTPRKCPTCGARLAVCEKNDQSTFIRLYYILNPVQHEYYCQQCDQHFDASIKLRKCIPDERPVPQQTGRRFNVIKEARMKLLRRFLIIGAIWVFFVIGVIGAIQTVLSLSSIEMSKNVPSIGLICGVAGLFLYITYLAWTDWLELDRLCYELIDEGVIVHTRIKRHFCAWEDFRIVTFIPGNIEHPHAYVFDLRQMVFTIDTPIEHYTDLVYDMIEHVKETANIDPRYYM